MKFKGEKTQKEGKKPVSSILMYAGAILVALIGIATLINNIILFNTSVASYVSQGYTKGVVLKQLIPGQLLPAIFEASALYGGIVIVLISAGIINIKLSKVLAALANSNNEVNVENELNIENKEIEIMEMEIEQTKENGTVEDLVEA